MVPFSLTLNIPLSRFWWQRISSDKRMNLLTSGSWSFSYPSTSCDHISAPPRFLRGGGIITCPVAPTVYRIHMTTTKNVSSPTYM